MASGDLIFNDTFTAGADENLDVHTPDVGDSWTQVYLAGTTEIEVLAASDRAQPTATATNQGQTLTADATYPSADYHLGFDIIGMPSAWKTMRVYGRYASQANNGYYGINLSSTTADVVGIWKGTGAATESLIAGVEWGTNPYAAGNGYVFELIGSDLAFYDTDEICKFTYASDAGVSAAGKAGLGMGAFWAGTGEDATTTSQIDNFKVVSLGANNTGWLNPTTTGEISNDFTNASNAYSSNNVDATVAMTSGVTYRQDYGDFGIDTGGANATGISVRFEGLFTDESAETFTVQIEVSKDNGSSWVGTKSVTALEFLGAGADSFLIFGHARSLWGTTWTASELSDANFRVRVSVFTNTGANTLNLDHISVRVHYDDAPLTLDMWEPRNGLLVPRKTGVVAY